MLGQVVWQQQESLTSGKHDLKINVQSFAKGVYNVRIKTKDGIVDRKLLHH